MVTYHPDYGPYAYVYNNPVRSVDLLGLDTFRIDISNRSIARASEDKPTHHTYIVSNGEAQLESHSLQINESGLVQFPASGEGFDRYGPEDEGGDHYLNPETAAALFGLTSELRQNDQSFKVSFGDMSDASGGAPGGDHQTHGGPKGYSGDCVDFRYLDRNGRSFRGYSADDRFSVANNWTFFKAASYWGFRKNYASNWNVWSVLGHTLNIQARKIGGHNDHGHLTYTR